MSFLMFVMPFSDKDGCQLDGKDYYGVDIDVISEIGTWEECGTLCHNSWTCESWTINTRDNNCILKKNVEKFSDVSHAISGDKSCYN